MAVPLLAIQASKWFIQQRKTDPLLPHGSRQAYPLSFTS
jgi:hypothetical protein